MISHQHKCIFIHTPKTGGTSLIDAFGMSFNNDIDSHFLNMGLYGNRYDWDNYRSNYKNYYTFSVIRNPWDRFVSGWKYCNSTKNRSLLDVLQNLPNRCNWHDWLHLTVSQYNMLYSEGKCVVNKLVRFENLQSDFDNICDDISMPRRKLKHLNTTIRKHYKEYFTTQEHLDLFYKLFEDDIEHFKYIY